MEPVTTSKTNNLQKIAAAAEKVQRAKMFSWPFWTHFHSDDLIRIENKIYRLLSVTNQLLTCTTVDDDGKQMTIVIQNPYTLTPEKKEEIKKLQRGGMSYTDLMKKYSLTRGGLGQLMKTKEEKPTEFTATDRAIAQDVIDMCDKKSIISEIPPTMPPTRSVANDYLFCPPPPSEPVNMVKNELLSIADMKIIHIALFYARFSLQMVMPGLDEQIQKIRRLIS